MYQNICLKKKNQQTEIYTHVNFQHVILELYKHANMIISILGQLNKFKYQTNGRVTHEK